MKIKNHKNVHIRTNYLMVVVMICLTFFLATTSCKCKKENTFSSIEKENIFKNSDLSALSGIYGFTTEDSLTFVNYVKNNLKITNSNDIAVFKENVASKLQELLTVKGYFEVKETGSISDISTAIKLNLYNKEEIITATVKPVNVYFTLYINEEKLYNDVKTEIEKYQSEISTLKANNPSLQSIKLKFNNLIVKLRDDESGDMENIINFNEFLYNNKDILIFINTKLDYSTVLDSYDKIQKLFDNGLRPIGLWFIKNDDLLTEKKIPFVKILQNRIKDPNFRLTRYSTENLTWDFTDFKENLTPEIIDTMRKAFEGGRLKVSGNSGQNVVTSGNFDYQKVYSVINYGDGKFTFFPTGFHNPNNVSCGDIPSFSIEKATWYACFYALTGKRYDENDPNTKY